MGRFTGDVARAALGTALSRVTGLGRDIAVAHVFGASASYDAYLVAFFVPNVLRGLLGEGGIAAAFVPRYSKAHAEGRGPEVAAQTLSTLLLVLPLVCLAGALAARWYIPVLAAGFPDEKLALAVRLGTWLFPVLGLVSLAAFAASILNTHGRFFVPAVAPALPNLTMVGAALLLTPIVEPPALVLVLGVLAGTVVQFLVQSPLLRGRIGRLPRPWPPGEDVRTMGRALLPVLGGVAMAELNVLVDNRLASYLATGSISTLQYAMRLFQLPIGVVAVSIAAAALPRLARSAQVDMTRGFPEALRRGIGLSAVLTLPALAGLLALGRPIIALLFEHGAFTADDTIRTYSALSGYLVGLWGYTLVYLFSRAFYALGRPGLPVLTGAVAAAANIGLDLLWVGPWGTFGLALATGVAGWVNACLQGGLMWRRMHGWLELGPIARAAAASAAMGLAVALLDAHVLADAPAWVRVAVGVSFGALLYVMLARALGFARWIRDAR